ncbi:MAG: cell wall hydrolase [Clostridia bacterium]|nr:cell wall hydrolase [Clostridia bacterium]
MKKLITCLVILSLFASFPAQRAKGERYRADYSGIELSESDEELIARAVRAEAKDENFLIKICVCSMLFNRMKDEYLPDTAQGTVYEPGAFLFASKESIEKDVDASELKSYLLLVRLICAEGIDPTCGALFCFFDNDPRSDIVTKTIEVDGLVFAKP